MADLYAARLELIRNEPIPELSKTSLLASTTCESKVIKKHALPF